MEPHVLYFVSVLSSMPMAVAAEHSSLAACEVAKDKIAKMTVVGKSGMPIFLYKNMPNAEGSIVLECIKK
jgi:histidine ammonia-lyase